MPSALRGNTTAPTIVIAEAADLIRGNPSLAPASLPRRTGADGSR
jgi:hypothetical protein